MAAYKKRPFSFKIIIMGFINPIKPDLHLQPYFAQAFIKVFAGGNVSI